jgi:hypothetical protein
MYRSLVVALTALLLAACESYEWQRPETKAAAIEEDLQYCREEARLEAGRSYGLLSGRLRWGSGYSSLPQQNRLTDFCMRNRGYTRVKVGSPPGAGAGG